MKKFLVKVNGQELEVEVQELNHTVSNKAPNPPKHSKQQSRHSNNSSVTAPMPGIITETHVKVGDTVTANQAVVTLEAMKMENEIIAGKDGQIREIKVSAGQSVSAGELLVVID